MKYQVAISGSYGGMNLGDESILEGILGQFRTFPDVEVTVFSLNPEDTKKRHNVFAVPIRNMHKEEVQNFLKKLDLFIVGGGGILFDGLVETILRDVIWAKELHIPVMFYAVSAGPLTKPESKDIVKRVLNQVEIITVREDESKRILHDLGVKNEIQVTADPALLIEPKPFTEEMLKNEGVDISIPLVAISIREPGLAAPDLNPEQYHFIFANVADFMMERFEAQVLFVPFESKSDSQHGHAIISKMINAKKALLLKGEYTSSQILGMMEHISFAVGMRLHFVIFAAMQGVPFFPLPYASKLKGFLESLEIEIPHVNEWNSGLLCASIDREWDTKKIYGHTINKKIPDLKKKAEETGHIFYRFLKTLTPKN